MEGASSSLMGFGDGAVLPPLMIMPLINPSPTSPLKPHSTPNDNEGNVALLSNTNTAKNTPTTATTSMVPFVDVDDTKAKIMSHPHYPRLLSAYVSCHKVGAPPEVVAKLEEARVIGRSGMDRGGVIGEDPALDQFMEAYCEMLTKYEEELSKPFKEAMVFLSRVESQFKSLTVTSSTSSLIPSGGGEYEEKNGSSEEDVAAGETFIDPQADESELKGQLLRKYSGYLGSLRKEFLKKRKKGKLPKEARQQLLDWWTRHYKWPYPSESQKVALAESTGLDQKQINNWFINQRKRHWKPSEEMQFVVMDAGAHPTHYYLENGFTNPFSFDCGQTLF